MISPMTLARRASRSRAARELSLWDAEMAARELGCPVARFHYAVRRVAYLRVGQVYSTWKLYDPADVRAWAALPRVAAALAAGELKSRLIDGATARAYLGFTPAQWRGAARRPGWPGRAGFRSRRRGKSCIVSYLYDPAALDGWASARGLAIPGAEALGDDHPVAIEGRKRRIRDAELEKVGVIRIDPTEEHRAAMAAAAAQERNEAREQAAKGRRRFA